MVHPLKSKFNKRNYYFIILAIWLVSALISLPTYAYRTYTERKWVDFVETHCDDLGWPKTYEKNENGCIIKIKSPLKRYYYTSVILILFVLPFFIMLTTYSIIIYKLWNRNKLLNTTATIQHNDPLTRKKKKVVLILAFVLYVNGLILLFIIFIFLNRRFSY